MKKKAILVLSSLFFEIAGCQKKPAADVHIKVVMKKYAIDPPLVRVKPGEVVALDVTTDDIQHGLDIRQLNIHEPVQPGKTTTIVFRAPAKGEYAIACSVICGPHHDDMKGKLIVE
jgi:cytochrome c oxidase subunit 2